MKSPDLSYDLFPTIRKPEGFGSDCRLFVEGRGYSRIADLVGMPIRVWNGNEFDDAEVADIGSRRLVTLELMNGLAVDCTPGQQFVIATVKNTHRPYTAQDLRQKVPLLSRPNWRVMLTNRVPDWRYPYQLPMPAAPRAHNARMITLDPLARDEAQLGEFLGRVATDGSLQRGSNRMGGTVRLFVAHHERCLKPRLESMLRRLGRYSVEMDAKHVAQPNKYKPLWRLLICSTTLADQLLRLDIKNDIPSIAWATSMLLASYVRASFDGDGTVHPDGALLTWGKGDHHLKWARHIQGALLLLGIRSRVRVYPGQHGSIRLQIQKRDMPLFCKLVGFMNPAKQRAADAITGHPSKGSAAYGRAISVKSITPNANRSQLYAIATRSGRVMVNGVVASVQ